MKTAAANLERLQSEIAFLSDCKDSEFYKRLIERVIPLIRELYPDRVKQWQLQTRDRYKATEVIAELNQAFQDIWEKVETPSRREIRRELIRLLQSIRGPAIEFRMPGFKVECGFGLLMSVFFKLQELHVNYVSLPQEYPFCTLAFKVIEFEKARRNENARTYLNPDKSFDKNRIARSHPFYLQQRIFIVFFSIRDNGSCRCNFPAKVLTEAKSLSHILQRSKTIPSPSGTSSRKWKAFDYEGILNHFQRSFAPISQSLIDRFKELDSDSESYTEYMWSALENLELAWSFRGTTLIDLRKPRLRGKPHELGLLSYRAHVEFSHKWNAREFHFLDRPNHAFGYLNRKRFCKYLEIIIHDLRYAQAAKAPPTIENSSEKFPDPPDGSDEQVFCDFYWDFLKRNASLPPHQRTQIIIIKKFKLSTYKLKKNYADSTLITWMRNANIRKKRRTKKSVG